MNNNLFLPPHVAEMWRKESAPPEEQTEVERGRYLPDPVGYKLLLILPEQQKQYDSGILKADQTVYNDEVSSVVAFVAKMGPEAYADKAKFPNGPWCRIGDFVIIRPYSGTRIKVHGKEMRLVNDDSIEGVVDDPRGITRIGA